MSGPSVPSWRTRAEHYVVRDAPAALRNAVPAHVRDAFSRLESAGHETVAVGGNVRDALLGRPVVGWWDLASAAAPAELVRLFPQAVPTGIEHGTVTLPHPDGPVEITSYRAESGYSDARRPDAVTFGVDLAEDLARRDFTVNALAFDVGAGVVLDAHHGLDDLESRILRAVGDPIARFREDALRPLRAARFVARLEFTLDPATREALTAAADLLPGVSAERVRDELSRLLTARLPSLGFEVLRTSGLLPIVLPELATCVGVAQNRFHAYDVYEHSLRSADAAPAGNARVRWATLLHDVGKPATKAMKDGDATFYGHPDVGARIADAVLERLRFPRAEREAIVHLVAEHLFDYRPEWSDAAVRRFVRRVGEANLEDLYALRAADAAGSQPESPKLEMTLALRARIARVLAARPPLSVRDLAIGGRDLMREFGREPGPWIGTILDACLERVLDDPSANTPETLMALARERAAAP